MTESEWNKSTDAGAMLDSMWQTVEKQSGIQLANTRRDFATLPEEVDALMKVLHQYYLSSCRAIWKLLPQHASRRGVELAEQYLLGLLSKEKLSDYNWDVEGAAFCLDYNTAPEAIDRWVADVRAMPFDELQSMLHPPDLAVTIDPKDLLKQAAYFVDYAMMYQQLRPIGPPPQNFRHFLSAELLRSYIDYPLQPRNKAMTIFEEVSSFDHEPNNHQKMTPDEIDTLESALELMKSNMKQMKSRFATPEVESLFDLYVEKLRQRSKQDD